MLNIVYLNSTLEILSMSNFEILLTEDFYLSYQEVEKEDLKTLSIGFEGDLQYTNVELVRNEDEEIEVVFTELPIPPTKEELLQAEIQGLQMALAEISMMLTMGGV